MEDNLNQVEVDAQTNEGSKETFVDKVKNYSEPIMIIATALAALYPIINYMYEMVFQANCEEFYGIPGKYFSANINSRLLYLGLILIIMIMFLFPAFLRNYEKKHGKSTKSSLAYSIFLSIILGMEMGSINLYNLIEIMKATNNKNNFFAYCNNWIDKNAYFVFFAIILFGSLSLVGMVLVSEIKTKLFRTIISVIFLISFMVSGALMIYGTIFKLGTSIEDKTKYEIVTNQDKQYVVISEEEDKVVVVTYSINKNQEYEFDTSQYLFLDKFSCEYSYLDTKTMPIIHNKNIEGNDN